FVFTSEVRTILDSGLVSRRLDPVGVLSFLAFGSVYEPWTIIEGIRAVPAGHVVVWEKDKTTSREYWSPVRLPKNGTEPVQGNGAGGLRTTLRDAVISHLVSDVPVGVFLSGGIDSSSLVAVMSQNGVRPSTFSLAFKEEEFDEGKYSR